MSKQDTHKYKTFTLVMPEELKTDLVEYAETQEQSISTVVLESVRDLMESKDSPPVYSSDTTRNSNAKYSLRIPPKLKNRLREYSAETKKSMTQVIIGAIRATIEKS